MDGWSTHARRELYAESARLADLHIPARPCEGIVNLSERRGEEIARGRACPGATCGSGGSGHAGALAPSGEGVATSLAIGFGGQAMAARAEERD